MSVEPLEEVADKLNKKIKKRHIKRLTAGECTVELGFVLADITTDFERIADHCSNIAVGLIQTFDDRYESHSYIDNLDKGSDTQFHEKYVLYKEKYTLPKKNEYAEC
jgi:phosphate:Na+ symporter